MDNSSELPCYNILIHDYLNNNKIVLTYTISNNQLKIRKRSLQGTHNHIISANAPCEVLNKVLFEILKQLYDVEQLEYLIKENI